jgi:hypothetical protein
MLSLLPLGLLPLDLREQVFRLVTEPSPAASRYRARVVRRAGRFARSGFLRPAGAHGRPGVWDQVLPTAGAAAFVALLGIGGIVALALLHHRPQPPPSALVITRSHAQAPPSSSAPPASFAAVAPSAAAGTPAAAPGMRPSPAPPPHRRRTHVPHAHHRPSPSPPVSPSPSPSPSPTPSAGVPIPDPATVVLTQPATGGPYTGQFTVTAQGGPADFTISDPAPPGDLDISPASGSLPDGGQVTVTVTVLSDAGLGPDTILTLTPGNGTVDVQYPPAAGAQAQLDSARSWPAAWVIAHSFPNATSRGRYFMPQSGASTRRSAGT